MKEIIRRVSYLKGLSDGLDLNKETTEGKLLVEIIDVLEEFSFALEDLAFRQDLTIENLEEIDDDLLNLEDYVYDLDSDLLEGLEDFNFEDFEDIYRDHVLTDDELENFFSLEEDEETETIDEE